MGSTGTRIGPVTLGERLQAILDDLPEGWSVVGLVVSVDEADADRAALILGSLSPGRAGRTFRLDVARMGSDGPSAEATRRALDRLEGEGIDARLSAGDVDAVETRSEPAASATTGLATAWDELEPRLPADWSDLYLEIELASSDEIERAALLSSPLNPFLIENDRPALRFRAARQTGYGAAPMMVRRCLTRLDEARIGGKLHLLRVQSETRHVLTQGPVWRDSGRAI